MRSKVRVNKSAKIFFINNRNPKSRKVLLDALRKEPKKVRSVV